MNHAVLLVAVLSFAPASAFACPLEHPVFKTAVFEFDDSSSDPMGGGGNWIEFAAEDGRTALVRQEEAGVSDCRALQRSSIGARLDRLAAAMKADEALLNEVAGALSERGFRETKSAHAWRRSFLRDDLPVRTIIDLDISRVSSGMAHVGIWRSSSCVECSNVIDGYYMADLWIASLDRLSAVTKGYTVFRSEPPIFFGAN